MADKTASFADLQGQLKEKVLAEINSGHSYEALQYVQSFVARKKRHMGKKDTSAMVFYGAKLLADNGAPAYAGTLVAWFVEDGAGEDFNFHMEDGAVSGDKYCDVQRINDLLNGLQVEKSSPIITKIYGPVHKAVLPKKNLKKGGPLSKRLDALEQTSANIFEQTKDWLSAYKAVLRLETSDVPRAAGILNKWSAEGFPTEKPMFFGRAVLQLLSDNKLEKASELVEASKSYVDAVEAGAPDRSAAMAVWNLSTILCTLSTMPAKPRVDPPKIFGIVANLYAPLIAQLDPKLVDLLEKVGVQIFGFTKPGSDAPNPMQAVLTSMLAGGGASGMDINNMMAMFQKMQQDTRR